MKNKIFVLVALIGFVGIGLSVSSNLRENRSSQIHSLTETKEWKFIFLRKNKYVPDSKRGLLTTSFEYYNNTGKNQLIDTVRISCGCIKVRYPHFPIRPEERGKIQVSIKLSQKGFFTKSLAVYFHGYPPVILSVRGKIES